MYMIVLNQFKMTFFHSKEQWIQIIIKVICIKKKKRTWESILVPADLSLILIKKMLTFHKKFAFFLPPTPFLGSGLITARLALVALGWAWPEGKIHPFACCRELDMRSSQSSYRKATRKIKWLEESDL